MSTWDVQDHYYSGQGVVMAAERNALGKPKGFTGFGNVSDLKVSIATTVLEHKESHTGQRGTDKRITTETKVTLSMTVENFIAANLASALRGSAVSVSAASAASETVQAYLGKVSALSKIKVSNVSVNLGATPLVAYTDETSAYDYLVNEDAGSLKFNDGSLQATSGLGVVITGVTVGSTTKLTVANTAAVGDTVTVIGATGADANILNGKSFVITARTNADVTFALNSTGKTVTTAAGTKALLDGGSVVVTYDYADQKSVEALTEGAKELYLRFEGLNTAEDNSPVVVDIFKFNTDPLKELALIGDGIGQFVLEGSVLSDSTQLTGSKYFKARQLV
jgi:hypothetical protein